MCIKWSKVLEYAQEYKNVEIERYYIIIKTDLSSL